MGTAWIDEGSIDCAASASGWPVGVIRKQAATSTSSSTGFVSTV